MCEPVFWNDLSAFVDGVLRLNVERSEENSRDLNDFAEWKRDCESSSNVVCYEFLEEFLLFVCALVVSEIEGVFDVLYSVLFVKRLKGPLRSVHEDSLHSSPARMVLEDRLECFDGLEFGSVTQR
jgi:hypothetical protein